MHLPTRKRVNRVDFPVCDLLVSGKDKQLRASSRNFKTRLETKHAEDGTPSTKYLGRTFQVTETGFVFSVGTDYLSQMPREFQLESLKSVQVLKRDKCDDSENLLGTDTQRRYRHMVGKLIWIDRLIVIRDWAQAAKSC